MKSDDCSEKFFPKVPIVLKKKRSRRTKSRVTAGFQENERERASERVKKKMKKKVGGSANVTYPTSLPAAAHT